MTTPLQEIQQYLAEAHLDLEDANLDLVDAREYRQYMMRDLDRRVIKAERRVSMYTKRIASLHEAIDSDTD